MNNHQKLSISLRGSAATFALSLALASTPSFAQEVPTPAAAEADTGEIIVTGSRISRPDLEANSPLTVVGAQEISRQAGSANIENVLNDLPQVTAVTSSTSNNPGGGVATVNLRNLGPQRTLVLVDGRRYLSFDVTQTVDLNTVPSALIERVDIVTGGQSAVYGSDAIAGVVNFVLKRDFSGVELNSSYDVTERGDGQEWDINGTIGSNFDDNRGNVTMFIDYTKRKATFAGERAFSRNALNDNTDGSPLFAAGGSPSIPQGRIQVPGLGAILGNGAGCTTPDLQTFNPDGSTHCFVPSDGYNFNPINYLQVPQERFLVSTMAQYEINEHFTPYLEAQFSNSTVVQQLAATPISNGLVGAIPLQVDSPFFAPSLQTALQQLDTDGDGYVIAPGFSYRTVGIGQRVQTDDRNAYRIVAGLKGEVGAGFNYDGYYLYSHTKNSQRQLGNVSISRFSNAVATKFDANGTLVCQNDGVDGCVPANIFGLGNLSPAAANYIGIGATNLEEYTTQVASLAFTNSSLFDLGAGGVGVAFGAEWRSEEGRNDPDTFLASGDVVGFNSGLPTSGRYTVREFFGEVNVPLLRDNFIHLLEVNGAARTSKYSNSVGNIFTWSAGVNIAPIEDVAFRAQYQKAIRGPSVSELFLGQTLSFAGNADSCGTAAAVPPGPLRDICVAQFNAAGAPLNLIGQSDIQDPDIVNPFTNVGGNPNLKEESAKTWTVGAIIKPRFLSRFSATVDYYNIKIKGLIGPVGTQSIGGACFQGFVQSFCNTIVRNSLGQIDSFDDFNVNTGGIKTQGVDVGVNYIQPIGALLGAEDARLSFKFDGSYLLKFDVNPIGGTSIADYSCDGQFGARCGVPTPKWRHSLRTTLGLGAIEASVQWRYIGKARDDDPATLYATETQKSQNYIDLTGSVDVNDNFGLNIGVSNLFDKKPPLSASTQNGGNGEQSNTYPTLYDVLGRAFFVSGKLKF